MALRSKDLRGSCSLSRAVVGQVLQRFLGENIRLLALAGAGIARLAIFHIQPDILAARLAPILEEHNPGDTEVVQAIFLGQAATCPRACER